FVERKTHWSRSLGVWILRYRSTSRPAQPAAPEPRTNKQNGARANNTTKTAMSSPAIRKLASDAVAFKATASGRAQGKLTRTASEFSENERRKRKNGR